MNTTTHDGPLQRIVSLHTPGPWTVEIDRWHYDTASTVVAGAERPAFPFRELLVQVGGTDVGRQEANTRLIAAAPEMLAMLQELRECAAYWSEYDVPIGIVERLDSVLAKALGVPPNAALSDAGQQGPDEPSNHPGVRSNA